MGYLSLLLLVHWLHVILSWVVLMIYFLLSERKESDLKSSLCVLHSQF